MSQLDDNLYQLVRRAVRDELAERANGLAPEPELERLPDAGKRFGVSVSWLEARAGAGELVIHGRGRMRRVRPGDVRALLRARGAKPAAPAVAPASRAESILRSLAGGKGR